MTDTCRLCRLGLLSRMPLCLGKHVEWDCGTARQCRLSRFIADKKGGIYELVCMDRCCHCRTRSHP